VRQRQFVASVTPSDVFGFDHLVLWIVQELADSISSGVEAADIVVKFEQGKVREGEGYILVASIKIQN
jgi:hypothetical protein